MNDPFDRLYERTLILRAQTGDEAAFAELVGRYQPRLRYFLAKLLGESHRVEDAVQEVWLDVFRGLSRLLDAGAFAAWLYRIARDRAYRELRRRRPPTLPLEEAELPGGEEEETFSAEEVARVHAALDELTPEHREALVLRFLEEMSYDAIAQVTGVPVGTVRSRLHHARRALREILERRSRDERERHGQGAAAMGRPPGRAAGG